MGSLTNVDCPHLQDRIISFDQNKPPTLLDHKKREDIQIQQVI